jgi:hypothetical protein
MHLPLVDSPPLVAGYPPAQRLELSALVLLPWQRLYFSPGANGDNHGTIQKEKENGAAVASLDRNANAARRPDPTRRTI